MTLALAIGLAATVGGGIAAWHYHRLGLTLAHYDARAHLVVARRIVDSITPGWQQIGAVWLPLPHLLNALPVQIDLFYRTGASAVAISVASYAIAAGAIAWIVLTITMGGARAFQASDTLPPVAASAVFALNPNVVYLQATPMTEPLLLATTTVAVAMLIAWCEHRPARRATPTEPDNTGTTAPDAVGATEPDDVGADPRVRPACVGIAFALACLTRYEAWPLTVSALVVAAWMRWRSGDAPATLGRDVGVIALYPAVAIAGFAIFSRVVIGQWFVGGDFFVPENKALGDWWLAAKEIGWGTEQLSGETLTWIGGAGVAIAALRSAQAFARRERGAAASGLREHAVAAFAIPFMTMALIPLGAFHQGHPFRIRYMVPLIAAQAIGAGIAAAAIPYRRARAIAAAALLAVVAHQLRPLDASSPMVAEAQWDRPNVSERARVTACIGQLEPAAKIMASMGSLGHYMQDASRAGLAIRDFLHEGNGDIWLAALESPRPFAQWMLIEEKAQGGDMLAKIARDRPAFLDGYQRVCDGAGMALYRRVTMDDTAESTDTDGDRGKD